MALETTPDKKKNRQKMDPRRLNSEKVSCATNINKQISSKIKLAKKQKNYRSNETCTRVVNNPTIIQTVSSIQPYPVVYSFAYTAGYTPAAAMPIVTTITPYVPPSLMSGYTYPDTTWNTIIPTMAVQNPIYTVPVPTLPVTLYNPGPPPICPYPAMMPSPVLPRCSYSILSPMAASVAPVDHFNQSFDSAFYEQTGAVPNFSDETAYARSAFDEKLRTSPVRSPDQIKSLNLDEYLALPKDLFPTARTLAVNPNPIIHGFCQEPDIDKHTMWILDLEFGVPRQAVTRPIATYDLQLNSIHCKNTPEAIHPGFESCSSEFKKTLLFYYDCAVSSWYKGFIITNSDRSVANFQSWLQVPMQKFGMCWP